MRGLEIHLTLTDEEFDKIAEYCGGKMSHGYDVRMVTRFMANFADMSLAQLLKLSKEDRDTMIAQGKEALSERDGEGKTRLISL